MQQQTQTDQINEQAISTGVGQDLRNSVLIVSVLLNLVVFITWLILQVTTKYDVQLVNFLFTR